MTAFSSRVLLCGAIALVFLALSAGCTSSANSQTATEGKHRVMKNSVRKSHGRMPMTGYAAPGY